MKSKFTTKKLTFCSLLTALMLGLGALENAIPLNSGIPGIKLGLSNGVLLFAMYMLDIPTGFVLMIMKVLLSGFLFGGVSAMMYALAGGTLSMIAMIILKKTGFSLIPVSMLGGAMHNIGQVLLAMLILKTKNLVYYMAVLAFVGLACGFLTGIVAKSVIAHSDKLHLDFRK